MALSISAPRLLPCHRSSFHGPAFWIVRRPQPLHPHPHCVLIRMLRHRHPRLRPPAHRLILCSSYADTDTEALEAASAPPSSSPSSPFDPSLVADRVSVLKKAAKTRKVAPSEVFSAIMALEKAKLDPSNFLDTLGGGSSGPRTWMLIFTASKKVVLDSMKGGAGGGSYFPVTAIQKFDSKSMTIENGVYLGPVGCLTFQGRISWKTRILAFIFESINIKIGSLGPFKFNIKKTEDEGRLPTTKDPFFIWFYADEEIIVARGRGGGVAFWCRCTRVGQ